LDWASLLGRTVDIALEPVAVGCAMAWLCAGLMLYRDARCAGWALGVVVVLLGVLRYQVDTALSPLPHMLGIGVFGQRGVVSGRIVEEPERGDDRVRFVVALEKMETDSAIYHLAGQALVTVKVPGFRAGYGDRVSLKGRLRRPHPARNSGGVRLPGFPGAARYLQHALYRQGGAGGGDRALAGILAR
jgi:hypothetical protein